MIAIISIIVVVILILITSYIFIRQRSPNKEKDIHSKQILKKPQTEMANTTGRKNKKQKKGSTKGINQENENKQSSDDFHENVKQITKACVLEDAILKENIEVMEPLLQASHDTKCMAMKSDVDKPGWNDNKKVETEQFQEHISKLNGQLEKAADENATLKNEAEGLNEENKTLKTQLKKSETLKSKIEEQLKKAEKSNNDSLGRYGDLERKLNENNAENLDLKHKIETINGKLHQKEADLKMELEKMHTLQTEKEASINKFKELVAKNKTDNENHNGMYRKYEERLNQLVLENKQIKKDMSQLDELLKEKNEIINARNIEVQKINMALNQVTNENKQLNEISCKLKSNETLFVTLEEEKMNLMTEMSKNSEALESKIQKLTGESEEKDRAIEELKRNKTTSQNEIDDLNVKLRNKDVEVKDKVKEMKILLDAKNADFERICQEKSILLNELESLKKILYNKDDNMQEKLLEMSKELKEKNNDLGCLQDQKLDLLQNIENLKKELSNKDEEIKNKKTERAGDVVYKDELINKISNENSTLYNKIEQLKNQIHDTNDKFSNLENKTTYLSTELKTKTENLGCLENDKKVLSENVERLKKELLDKEESFKIQLAKSENKIKSQEKAKSAKGKKGDILKEKDPRKFPIGTVADNHLVEDQLVNETFQAKCYQESQTGAPSNDSSVGMQGIKSHTEKIETELLIMQKKYYELKNANSITVKQQPLHKPVQNNICLSETVSIPPTQTTDDSRVNDVHVDNSIGRNNLLESIEKLNSEIAEQRLKNQNLQKSFSDTSTEKNHLNSEYKRLLEDHDRLICTYKTLANEFTNLKNSSQNENIDQISLLSSRLEKCHEENCHLKTQLEQYRETLEKTEECLQNIQASVDQEENNWKTCFKSAEQEQERLENKNKELLNQIEELRSKKNSDSSAVVSISMETPSIANGAVKKKRKNKNKKKKNKNRVTQ